MIKKRRDSKDLLAYVQEEERKQKSGKLKIFLGAAPGVGKTYAMLEDALLRAQEGSDVIVGLVESHGRKETESFLSKLPSLPRKEVEYHGQVLKEFDLDAALNRNPGLILVDELAHTNAPFSRHEKRWQDVIELLDNGIDVYTTLNVQHIESLNNIVSQIINIKIRETVPDTLFERATSIALIDLPPEDLLKRLDEGKVYVPEDIKSAKDHFFKKSNLRALREIALRFTAEQVDTEVLLDRHGEAKKTIWPTTDRLLICVGPDHDNSKLIRAGFRLAKSLHADWMVMAVETLAIRKAPSDRATIIELLRLAEQLGAETIFMGGMDIVDEILQFAHERNVTKIIVGKRPESIWKSLFVKSVADKLLQKSQDIDVYVLHLGETLEKEEIEEESSTTPLFYYFLSLLVIFFGVLINLNFREFFDSASTAFIFILGTIFVSLQGYYKPAILTAILSIMGFILISIHSPPSLSLSQLSDINLIISNITNMTIAQSISVIFMTIVSFLMTMITLWNKEKAEFSHWRERRVSSLLFLSKKLASVRGIAKLLEVAKNQIADVFDSNVTILLPNANNELEVKECDRDCHLNEKEMSVARWVFEKSKNAGLGTDTLPQNQALYLPLLGTQGAVGVLRILPKHPSQLLIPEQLHLLEGFAIQVAIALEVDKLQEENKKSELELESTRVRNFLLKYVSDNMQSPIVDIMGSANSLIEIGHKIQDRLVSDLSRRIYNNTDDLNHLISKLSQLVRLETLDIGFKRNYHLLDKIIKSALTSLERRLEKRKIHMFLPPNLGKIYCNKFYIEQVFFNIIENAIKYSPDNTVIDIIGLLEPTHILISIEDQGEGVAVDEINKIFDMFYRGQSIAEERGLGLGLTICQRIIKIHGGDIWVENKIEGGAKFRFTLPVGDINETSLEEHHNKDS